MALYSLFSVSLIPVCHHRIWYFPVMGGVKRGVGGGGLHVSKERGEIKNRGDEKRNGADTPFRTMLTMDTMDHKLVLENSSSAGVNTLPNTITYLMAIKYLNIRLRHIY